MRHHLPHSVIPSLSRNLCCSSQRAKLTTEGHSRGFTLTELLVLVGVGAILSSVLIADFSQVRLKLLQQACAANLKQWGMAFGLYAQDYNGCLFMQQETFPWDDTTGNVGGSQVTNVYLRYLGGGNVVQTLRTLRVCPYVAATISNYNSVFLPLHTYSMTEPLAKGLAGLSTYQSISEFNSGIDNFEWITLKTVPYPSQFLLLMDGGTTFVHAKGFNGSGASGLVADGNGTAYGTVSRAIDRHGGGVNMLFGDFHVAFVTSNQMAAADSLPQATPAQPNPWFCEN